MSDTSVSSTTGENKLASVMKRLDKLSQSDKDAIARKLKNTSKSDNTANNVTMKDYVEAEKPLKNC